jgi:hypothetical protein
VACNIVRCDLHEAKLGTADVTLNPDQFYLTSTIPTGLWLSWQPWEQGRFRPCKNLPEPPISHVPPSIEGLLNRSGSYNVFFAGCPTFCQTLRR